jgi:hypothetical protein
MHRSLSELPRIRTAQSAKLRSRTRSSKDNHYLDLFVLNMERTRLNHEIMSAEKRLTDLKTGLMLLDKEISRTECSLKIGSGRGEASSGRRKQIKTMVIDY